MASYINTNMASLNAQRNLTASQSTLSTSLQRLSSGLRINSAKDDAAGLAISDRMTSQINGLTQASRNANDGISLSQTAEGALSSIGDNLQRIRTLALQSANSTNSASDRAALNSEVTSALAEIGRVASTTQFNGLNLLDGSFANSQFQVGANANQTISVSIRGATTAQLGAYRASSSAVTSTAFDGANLQINGVAIGVSAATTANGVTAGSAAAKATAINAATAQTGVTATASTTLSGTAAPITGSSLASGSLTVNGVAVGAIAAGTSAVSQGQNAASAINAITAQTGVTASVNMSTGALTLASSEGRDIKLDSAAGNNASVSSIYNATGLSVGTAPTGHNTATLAFSQSGGFGQGGANDLASGNTVAVGGKTYEFTTNASSVASGNIAVVLSSTAPGSTDAQVASALQTAVHAQFSAGNSTVDATVSSGTVTFTDARLGNNSLSPVATGGGSGMTVTANTATGTDGTYTAGGITTHGTLTLSSAENFTLSGSSAGMLTAAGLSNASPSLSALSSVDISTQSGANSAISIIDGALQQVNSQRATLGAVQNRFTSAINNLTTSSENISAARSRIQDTDFAAETASLTRAQILQQAGTAMLAQANSLPNGVLSLLRGG